MNCIFLGMFDKLIYAKHTSSYDQLIGVDFWPDPIENADSP